MCMHSALFNGAIIFSKIKKSIFCIILSFFNFYMHISDFSKTWIIIIYELFLFLSLYLMMAFDYTW